MSVPLLVTVAVLGVAATVGACIRVVQMQRRGAPREVVLGWFAVMLAVATVSLLVLRLA